MNRPQAVTILETIVAQKRIEVAKLPPVAVSLETAREAMSRRADRRDFLGALRRTAPDKLALIAEVKRASPSAGLIRPSFDAAQLAREYEAAGAACVSVVTDERFFQGSPRDLCQVRAAVKLPLLRKDFIIDERQVLEAIEWGADAILLIAAILDDHMLRRMHDLASAAGLAPLVEVHDEHETERALGAGARLVGVNNRDLRDFRVDLGTTERVVRVLKSELASGEVVLVSESGIHTRADVERVRCAGARAVLVGEAMLRAPAIGEKVAELTGPDHDGKEYSV